MEDDLQWNMTFGGKQPLMVYKLAINTTAGFLSPAVGQGSAETGGNKHQLEVGARVDRKTAMENIWVIWC